MAAAPERQRPRVVIVGAGFGGLAAARELSRHDVDITVIDRKNHHLFQPLLYQVATAGLSPADIAQPIRAILRRQKRTHVLLDSVAGIDRAARQVALASGATVEYDHLIVATGATHNHFGATWADRAPGIKTIDDALSVRRTVLLALECAETRRQERLEERAEFLTFVIVGGGPTGVEMAGAIAELTRTAAEMDFKYVTRHCVRIILVHSDQRLLASFPEKLRDAAAKSLRDLGVELRLSQRVTAIDDAGVMIGEEKIRACTVVWAAGVRASPAGQWLGAACDRAGRVIVDHDLTLCGAPEISVIGDTAAVTMPDGKVVPGLAPAAKQQGVYAAKAIIRRIAGKPALPAFRYKGFGNLATIGRSRAVADFGWLRLSGFPAWVLWCVAHVFFLIGFRNRLVVCANWGWNYLTFERGARLITGADAAGERILAASRGD